MRRTAWTVMVLVAAIYLTIPAHGQEGEVDPPLTIVEVPTAPATTPPTSSAPAVIPPAPPAAVSSTTPITAAASDQGPGPAPPEGQGQVQWLALGLLLIAAIALLTVLRGQVSRAWTGRRPRRPPGRATRALPFRSTGFEVVEYVRRQWSLGERPGISERLLGEFKGAEEALERARTARSAFQPSASSPDAWWIVRPRGSLRAMWIAESGDAPEQEIDLRPPSRHQSQPPRDRAWRR